MTRGEMKRVLALDVGERRIGVAVTDPLGITAQGVETIETRGEAKDIERVVGLAARYQTDRVVVGLPKTLRGEIGQQAEKVIRFAEKLAPRGLQVRYQDERLTTSLAQRALLEGGARREKRRQVVDMLAAEHILETFMASGGWLEADMSAQIEEDGIE